MSFRRKKQHTRNRRGDHNQDGDNDNLRRFWTTGRDFAPLISSLRSVSSPAINGEPKPSEHQPATSIPLSAMPLISPNALLYAHLSQETPRRTSGRYPGEFRPIDANIGSLTHCDGSSLVRIGATTMVCGVRAEILPVSEIPSYRVTKSTSSTTSTSTYNPISLYSLLVPNLELSTGCSPLHLANTAPSTEAQSLSQRLLSLLLTSKLLSPSELEIIYTPPSSPSLPATSSADETIDTTPELKAYWVLYIDIMCISYGGSLFDCAWLALYAALRDTILPKAWYDADEQKIFCSPEIKEGRRLESNGMPVSLTFAAFEPEKMIRRDGDRERWVLSDTDAFEEDCCEGKGCVVVDKREDGEVEIVRFEKSGGDVVGVEEVVELVQKAAKRWSEWKVVLEKALRGNG